MILTVQQAKALASIESIRKVLRFRDAILEFLPGEKDWAGKKVRRLIDAVPSSVEWRIYDHVACFNSLYTTLETCAHEVIDAITSDYISNAGYGDLPAEFIQAHRDGVEHIRRRLTYRQYRHLDENDLIAQLNPPSRMPGQYEIAPETIRVHDRNLKMDVLSSLFRRAGIEYFTRSLEAEPAIVKILDHPDSTHPTLERQLNEFVDIRNDCSHGEVDEVLGLSQQIYFCEFVASLCEAMCGVARSHLVEANLNLGIYFEIGRVIEHYRDNISVSRIEQGQFSVGDSILIALSGGCFTATIQSIQIGGQHKDTYSSEQPFEIGLQTDVKLRRGMRIIHPQS